MSIGAGEEGLFGVDKALRESAARETVEGGAVVGDVHGVCLFADSEVGQVNETCRGVSVRVKL